MLEFFAVFALGAVALWVAQKVLAKNGNTTLLPAVPPEDEPKSGRNNRA